MHRIRSNIGVALVLLCLHAMPSQASGVPPPTLAWIGLYNGALLEWLENANRLEALCGKGDSPPGCRTAHMQPKTVAIALRAAPNSVSRVLGNLIVIAMPGTGLQAVASVPGAGPVRFTPDLYDSDWGYGPYFHQTVLERKDDAWFRVPVPSIGPAWIHARDWIEPASPIDDETLLRTVAPGQVIIHAGKDLLVLGVEDRVLRARSEQKADQWCEAGQPPPLESAPELRIPFWRLFDGSGRMLIRYKYMRGC